MKVAMMIFGTRGDVQPMIALAIGLMNSGHEVVLCAPPENEALAGANGCRFFPVGTNLQQVFKNNSEKEGTPKSQPSPKFLKQAIADQINALPEIIRGSDIVLGVGYVFGVPVVADYLHIPYRFMAFYPAIMGPGKDASRLYRLLWFFSREMTNILIGGYINKQRKHLGLKPAGDIWASWMGKRVIVASDPVLSEVPEGVGYGFVQTGYMPLTNNKPLDPGIEKFIDAGIPPVFVSFGSNPIHSPEDFSRLLMEVAKTTGQRLIISRGWAGLSENTDAGDCLFVDEVPFGLLFPRLAAIVHHGGTGTMAAAARAGIPQVVFPFMADQFQNRDQIVKLGLGPGTCDFKKLSEEALSSAISECLSDMRYKRKAGEIAAIIQPTDGIELTIKAIENELNIKQ